MKLGEVIYKIRKDYDELYEDLEEVYSKNTLMFIGEQCSEWFFEGYVNYSIDDILEDYVEYFEFEDENAYHYGADEIEPNTPMKAEYIDKEQDLIWELLYIFRIIVNDNVVRLGTQDAVGRRLKEIFWDACIVALSNEEDQDELLDYSHEWGVNDVFGLVELERNRWLNFPLKDEHYEVNGKKMLRRTPNWIWQGDVETFKALVQRSIFPLYKD